MDQVRRPSQCLELWRTSGAFASLIPALLQVAPNALAAPDHIGTPDLTSRPELKLARRRNRMASILVDLTPREARQTLDGLRSSRKDTEWGTHAVACWHELSEDMASSLAAGASDAVLRRWASVIGRTMVRDFLRIAFARWVVGRREAGSRVGTASTYRRALQIAFRDPIAIGDLAVDGTDLMDAGIPAGPAVGRALRRLLELVLEDPARNQRDELLALALSRRWPTLAAPWRSPVVRVAACSSSMR
jgi:hypothetical protein